MPHNVYAKQLLLGYIAKHHVQLCKEAKQQHLSHTDFLDEILSREIAHRLENRKQRRIRDAHFPYRKYLQDLDLSQYDKDIKVAIEELMTLEFVSDKQNAIFISNPGRGKTHLAIGLGIACCLLDKRVLFTSVPNLVVEIKEAMSARALSNYKSKFEKWDLVVIDELGYVSFDREGNEILFNMLSNRCEKGSMIVTTNLVFEKWEEVFKDTNLTGALVDRLAYKAHILDMSGDSYRVKETKKMRTISGPVFE